MDVQKPEPQGPEQREGDCEAPAMEALTGVTPGVAGQAWLGTLFWVERGSWTTGRQDKAREKLPSDGGAVGLAAVLAPDRPASVRESHVTLGTGESCREGGSI